jgi:PAS domain S-box-containing protein
MNKIRKIKGSILIVEDESVVSLDIQQYLDKLGYHIEGIARSGKEAIEKAQKTRPDLILMDIVLKNKMDGIEAASVIKKRYDIPCLFITAYSDNKKLKRVRLTQPYGYIIKPFSKEELKVAIELAFDRREIEKITNAVKITSLLAQKERDVAEEYLNIIGNLLVKINKEGVITMLNKKAYQILGYKEGSLIGKNWFDVCIPKELRPRVKEVFSKIIKGEMEGVKNYEYAVLTKKGELRIIQWHNAYLKDTQGVIIGTLSSGEDVTDRKFSERQLLESKELLQTVIESIPSRIFWKDKDLNYLGCNTLFAKDAGMDNPEDLVGKNDFDTGWKDQAELYLKDDKNVLETGVAKTFFVEPQTTPDGKKMWRRTSKNLLKDSTGNTIGIIGVYDDITEQKENEMRLNEKIRQMEFMGRMSLKHYKKLMMIENKYKKLKEELNNKKNNLAT